MKDLEFVTFQVKHQIEYSGKEIAKFQAKLSEDPVYALEWSMSAFQAAAKQRVYQEILAHLETEDPVAALAEFHEDLQRVVINGARWPSRSTSPSSNLMAQCVTEAQADVLADWNLKFNLSE